MSNKKENTKKYLEKPATISVLELINLIENYRNYITINYTKLINSISQPVSKKPYQRQGIKRIRGIRDCNGNLVNPYLGTKNIDNSEYVKINGFNINSSTATINMLISQRVQLYKLENKALISEVAGVLLNNLNSFKNYTIVSEGALNISHLFVKISNKKVFEKLYNQGLLQKHKQAVDKFDFRHEYIINLENLPLLPKKVRYHNLQGLFPELAKIKILISILNIFLRQTSERFTSEQISELKKHYLSESVYINFPTTTEYLDLETALANRSVEKRESCQINIGSKDILNLSKFYSASKFFQRRYEFVDLNTGEIFSKPMLNVFYQSNLIFRHKSISSRMKITKVDEFMQDLFDDFLGLEDNGTVLSLLQKVRASKLKKILKNMRENKYIDENDIIIAMKEAKIKLKKYSQEIYRKKLYPVMLHFGIKGTFPQKIAVKTMTGDELIAKYPHLNLSPQEQKRSFFEVGESIISTYFKTKYYSTEV